MSDPILARDVEPESITWLWRNRIPRGMLSIVGGKPDQGKGLFCAHVAAEVSRMVFEGGRQGKVLYSATEDSHGLMTRPRLEAAGANMDNIFLWRFMIPYDASELTQHIIDKEIDLLVMDPFAAHLSGNISRHSDNVRQILTPLSGLAEQTGMAILITEHVLKRVGKNAHPLSAIGGSGSGLPAASRMAFIFGKDPDDEDRRMLCAVKNNICERPPEYAFELDVAEIGDSDVPFLIPDRDAVFDVMKLLTADSKPGQMGRPPDRREQAAEWLANYLYERGEPVRAGQVIEDAKQNGLTVKTLRAAVEDMGVVRNPPGGGRSCKWSLPDDILTMLRDADPDYDPAKDKPSGNVDTGLTADDMDAFSDLLGGS